MGVVGIRPGRRALAAVLCLGALGAACTTSQWDTSQIDHPSTTAPKTYPETEAGLVESLTDHLSQVGPNLNEWAPPRDEAECAARKVVKQLGVDRLLDLGYDTQRGRLALQWTDDEKVKVTNILSGCIDVAQGLLSIFSAYDKLDVPAAACLTRGIDRRGLDRDFVSGILDGTSPDPFARDNQLGIGISRLMIECFDAGKDLLPIAPLSPFPQDVGTTTTTSTTAPPSATTTSVP